MVSTFAKNQSAKKKAEVILERIGALSIRR